MVEMVTEKSGNLRKEEESQGILTGCLSFSQVLYQEVMEKFLRSRKSQGK